MQLTQLPDETTLEFLTRLEAAAAKDFEENHSLLAAGYAIGIACNGAEVKAAHQQQARNGRRARQTRWYVNDVVVAKKDIGKELASISCDANEAKGKRIDEIFAEIKKLADELVELAVRDQSH